MAHPEYIYYALVVLIAWPCSVFSRCAAILALTWAVGQIAYVNDMLPDWLQVVLYLVAAGATFYNRLGGWCVAIAALYLPLIALYAFAAPTYDRWWAVFVIAVIQVLLVPATVDWGDANEVRLALRDRDKWRDLLYAMSRMAW